MKAESATGILWVCAQAVLLVLWALSIPADAWSEKLFSNIPLALSGAGMLLGGCILMFAGTFSLGRNLTPSPVPKRSASLVRQGIYRHVRHPIYGGILLIVWGITLPFLHLPSLAWAAGLLLFFHLKASFEEQRLASRFPEYEEYRGTTWRFLPRFHRTKKKSLTP